MTAESRPVPHVDLEWDTQPAPDVIEVSLRRGDAQAERDPIPRQSPPQARARAADPDRVHGSPLLLGALFGVSALAIVALLAVMLWTGGRGAGPHVGAESPLPAFPQPGYASNPYGSHTTVAGTGPAASLLPTVTAQSLGATSTGRSQTAGTEPRPLGSTTARAQTPHGSGEPNTLRAGDQGPEVTTLQRLLFQQGFTYVDTTGIFDEATTRGVAQLQRDRSLSCDPPGVYGPCTRAALTG